MLAKFHPELNAIERLWGRMKYYIRKFTDGKLETLIRLIDEALSERNVDLAKIRRYVRLTRAYLIAYRQGLDIVQADRWIKKHRSHRGVSAQMDTALEALYFPLGRQPDVNVEDQELESEDQFNHIETNLQYEENLEQNEDDYDENHTEFPDGYFDHGFDLRDIDQFNEDFSNSLSIW